MRPPDEKGEAAAKRRKPKMRPPGGKEESAAKRNKVVMRPPGREEGVSVFKMDEVPSVYEKFREYDFVGVS